MRDYKTKEFSDYIITLDDGIEYFCNFAATIKIDYDRGSWDMPPDYEEEITDIFDLEISYYTEDNELKRSKDVHANNSLREMIYESLTGDDF
tara:strand:+ start:115 stop:390 length:276 start_codon:yes stop_codon:yes gene_type:complete